MFDMQPLILVHLRFVFFFRAEQQLFLYTFFHKEGQRRDNLDVICKDKGYALPRATCYKNYF